MAGTTDEEARRLRRVKRGLVAALATVLMVAGCRAATRGRVTVLVDGRPLRCEVADTPARRAQGLQGYRELAEGRGMLFVNDAPVPVSIEMKSVRFPIDVAFVGSDLRVMKVASLYPEAAREVSTSAPALYVIETPEGWLDDNGIGVGSSLAFLGGRPSR